MKINLIETKEILDLEQELNRELEVNERTDAKLNRFYVKFKGGEIIGKGDLISYTGNGNTIDKALKDYCKQISNKTIVFGAYSGNRREINLPKLVHTKLLKK